MKSNYKRLGDYIRQVDVRNRDLTVSELLGVNLDKEFIPSVANTIGTDMSNYKLVSFNQFGCKLMSVERDGKMPIALYKKSSPSLISSAYYVFEVVDANVLNPDYLFMWIKRREFDRQLWFSSGGDVRGGTSWENLCNMPLLLPTIEQQRKIVSEYQAVERRIENNRRLIATLEDAAQTIYRRMFVDNIDPNNLPEGWRMGKMSDLATFSYGKMPIERKKGNIPVFSGYGTVGYCTVPTHIKQHIIVIARGDSGSGQIVRSPQQFFLTNLAISINLKDEKYRDFIYYYLNSQDTYSLRTGSAQAQVTIDSISNFDVLIPSLDYCSNFYNIIEHFEHHNRIVSKENQILGQAQALLLSQLSTL